MRRALLLLGVLVALLLPIAGGCQPAVPAGDVEVHMVPMRDGVRLSTAVVLPEGERPWPVVFSRTPYGKSGPLGNAAQIVRRGYARVVQDTRGRFDSEGLDSPFINDGWGELRDGYDTIEWIANQPWCDGNVGMTGGSALGITQYLAAGAGHPALKCCHVVVAPASLYHQAAFPGGAFSKALVEDWTRGHRFSAEGVEFMFNRPLYDDMWATVDLTARAPQVSVPMMHQGGWYDVFAQGTLDAFRALQHEGGEGARGNQILVMGPWGHGSRPVGELEFPDNALRNPSYAMLEAWFERWFTGRPTPALEGPPVHYYVMGACGEPDAPGNEWRRADDWPIPAEEVSLYLRADGAATFEAPQEQVGAISFRYDPANPVPTRGGCNLTIPSGPMDQRPVEDRPDVLVFTTEPLAEPLEVTGRIFAELFVSSDSPDTDFTAKLTDVYPDGRSMLLCDGILRVRNREGFDREDFMEPGEVYQARVDLWSTSIIFNRGHRIRVAISSSNAPRFDPNPNTGAPFRADDERRIATNTVHMDRERPSRIILPTPQK